MKQARLRKTDNVGFDSLTYKFRDRKRMWFPGAEGRRNGLLWFNSYKDSVLHAQTLIHQTHTHREGRNLIRESVVRKKRKEACYYILTPYFSLFVVLFFIQILM